MKRLADLVAIVTIWTSSAQLSFACTVVGCYEDCAHFTCATVTFAEGPTRQAYTYNPFYAIGPDFAHCNSECQGGVRGENSFHFVHTNCNVGCDYCGDNEWVETESCDECGEPHYPTPNRGLCMSDNG